jgi:hypothetical protein
MHFNLTRNTPSAATPPQRSLTYRSFSADALSRKAGFSRTLVHLFAARSAGTRDYQSHGPAATMEATTDAEKGHDDYG